MAEHTDQIRFSIVVPAYNEAAYLGPTLQSLQRQDYPGAYEVIVVDNNSTDATASVAASYGVRVLSESEQGVCAARQRGSAAAVGDIIVSADADTIYPTGWLRGVAAAFGNHDDIVAIAGPCRYSNASWWMNAFPALLFGAVRTVFALTGLVLYVSATNLAVRRTQFPGYDVTLTQGGDELDLLRRLRHRGRVVWDQSNMVTTSPRRFAGGLVYSIVFSLIVHYLLTYGLNRLTGRRTLGTAPAFRGSARLPMRVQRRLLIGTALLLLALAVGLITVVGPSAASGVVHYFLP
jgi:glycosyltransferase involved in cell wall biosynthesis